MSDMNEKNSPSLPEYDEQMLIDDILGELDEKAAAALRERSAANDALAARRNELAKIFKTLDFAGDIEAPQGLASRTMSWIESAKETSRLIGFEQFSGGYRPTFSLRETLAVAAVLVIAVTVIFSTLTASRQRLWQNLCTSQMGEIGTAFQNYAMSNDSMLPTASSETPENWLNTSSNRPANSSALFRLLKQEYVHNPRVFQCPANGPRGFTVDREKSDFPDHTFVGYSYQYSIRRCIRLDDSRLVVEKFVVLADQTPYFKNGQFDSSAGISRNHSAGQSVLYADGHTAWVRTSDVGVSDDNIFLISSAATAYSGTEKPSDDNDSFLLPN